MVLVEVPVKGDFITDDADLLVLRIFLAGIYPSIGHMGLHFFKKVGFVAGVNRLARVEGDVFVVAQFAVGLVFLHLAINRK
ncbi:hypothetical protein D3C85_1698580 [compost metagenome]